MFGTTFLIFSTMDFFFRIWYDVQCILLDNCSTCCYSSLKSDATALLPCARHLLRASLPLLFWYYERKKSMHLCVLLVRDECVPPFDFQYYADLSICSSFLFIASTALKSYWLWVFNYFAVNLCKIPHSYSKIQFEFHQQLANVNGHFIYRPKGSPFCPPFPILTKFWMQWILNTVNFNISNTLTQK